MTKAEFKEWVKDRIVFLDGATGTLLMARGMSEKDCHQKWIMENPDALIDAQKKYIDAGSNIVLAPTFGAHRAGLEKYGEADNLAALNAGCVALSKKAVGEKGFVSGDISMTGLCLDPFAEVEEDAAFNIFKEQIAVLAEAGCDMISIETMISLEETRDAVLAANAVCDLSVLVSMTFEENGRTLFGTTPEEAAKVLEEAGADSVGANCSVGPEAMVAIIEKMAAATSLPIIAKPNAGKPVPGPDGSVHYSMGPEEFAAHMQKLVSAGARLIGGCCGTSPEYIACMSRLLG